jgi:hypothetical protein
MCDSDNRVSEVGRDDGVLDILFHSSCVPDVLPQTIPGGCPQVRNIRLDRGPFLVLSLARRWP